MRLLFKLGFILFLILLLMIPNALIRDLIRERQGLENQTQLEIAASWGPNQYIYGPVLSIPFTKKIPTVDGFRLEDSQLRILPKSLNFDVQLNTEERKKSIYKAILYTASHKITGEFDLPELSAFGSHLSEIYWERALLDMGFSSAAGITDIVHIDWQGKNYKMSSGASDSQLFESGIHSIVTLDPENKAEQFSINMNIRGSRSVEYLPLAETTLVSMTSDWASPGFIGQSLPISRQITNDGFTSKWKLTEYNRSVKSHWFDYDENLLRTTNAFGVELVQTVGHYQKTTRSAKYALLIISLSFFVFFFFEMRKGNRMHPIQYIFVGIALSIFYTLLLSFSEHIGFDMAYVISVVAVVGLIGWYSQYILKNKSNITVLIVVLFCLYMYIYVLLQMNEFALLVGSIGLFLILAIAMYLSRDINWYEVD